MPRPRTILTDEARRRANRDKASRYYNSHKEIVLQKIRIKTTSAVQRNQEHLILKRKVRQLCSVAVKLDFKRLKFIIDQLEPLMTDDASDGSRPRVR